MQMVKNSIIGLILGYFVLLVFMPKQELYYKLEEALQDNDIVINEQKIHSGLFSLSLEGLDVYVKGIKVAKIDEVNLFTLLFYTKIQLTGIDADDSLKNMMPIQIEEATITHSLINPYVAIINANSDAGDITGASNLRDRTVRLDFNTTTNLDTLKSQLNQDEKGWYYETSF